MAAMTSEAPKPLIQILPDGPGRVTLKPKSFLGGNLFKAYQNACSGSRFDFKRRCQAATLEAALGIVGRLQEAGFALQIDTSLTEALKGEIETTKERVEDLGERIEAIDTTLKKRGLSLYGYQKTDARWLASRRRFLLGWDMGCVDGGAIIRVNRARRGFPITLRDLYHRFHGLEGKWDPNFKTSVRALCGDELRQHPITDVLFKGKKPVLLLKLVSGRSIRVTPDHEIATPTGFVAAEKLVPGSTVLANGQTRCWSCQKTTRVALPEAKFAGACHQCIRRKFRDNRKDGRHVDQDGYVRISRQYEHPRANTSFQVYEHILVMEKHIGRFISRHEIVHHMNGDRSDNRLENLELQTVSSHAVHHGREGGFKKLHGAIGGKGGKVWFVPVIDEVKSIAPAGEIDVYDIVCEDPHRNFVADGIIVHNCGKTLAALITAPDARECGVLVVAPAVAKGVWKREAAKWRPEFKVTVISGRGNFRWPNHGEIVVMNYDILPKAKMPAKKKPFTLPTGPNLRQGLASLGLLSSKPTHTEQEKSDAIEIAKGVAALACVAGFSQRLPPCPKGVFLVADEAHFLKNSKSARTIAFRAISEAVRTANGSVGLLTATPQLNKRPQELWSVLEAADLAREAFGSWNEYVRLFGGRKGKWGYEWPDYTMTSEYPLPEAAERLRRVMVRRVKKDVLKDLPEKRYQAFEVDLDKGTRKACDDVLALLLESGIDPDSDGFCEEAEQILFSEVSALRAKLATAKIDAMLELVEEHEQNDEPCIVFSAHRAPIDKLVDRPGWTTITGDTSNEERTRIENDFQAGKYKGIGCTIKAAGLAITLTYAASEIFVDRAWTPADNAQAEDRAYRIGQTRGVLITDLVGDHKIERRVHELLVIKKALISRSVEQTVGEPVAAESTIDFAALAAAAEAEEKRLGAGKKPRRGPQTPREKWAKKALLTLAMLDPDRAAELNGVGFNATDGAFGHSLAAQVKDKGLTDKQWSMATVMCSKYHGQVGPLPPKGST